LETRWEQNEWSPVWKAKRKDFNCLEYILIHKSLENLLIHKKYILKIPKMPKINLEIFWDTMSPNKILKSHEKDYRTFH